jgi:hypothetical protein
MPFLIRFMIRHALVGFLLGIIGAAIAVGMDFGHLRSLAHATSLGWIGLGAFCFLMGLTFGGLQIGFAVMLLPYEDDDQPPRGRAVGLAMVPIPVPIQQQSRRP